MQHINTVGQRTLICSTLITLAGILFHSGALAQEAPKLLPGRYQIIMHPTFRADQYLLDTATGKIWQLTKFGTLKGEPEAWKFMTRLDDQAEYVSFLMSHPSASKPVDLYPKPVPPPARPPKIAPPQKLN